MHSKQIIEVYNDLQLSPCFRNIKKEIYAYGKSNFENVVFEVILKCSL